MNDEDDGVEVGGVSLRDAVEAAGEAGFDPVVQFAPALNGGTIELDAAFGEIQFGKTLTIDASMLSLGITINASTAQSHGTGVRIFNITDPTGGSNPPLVTLRNLTLTGADAPGDGGAIFSAARLFIEETTIQGNGSAGSGGAIFLQVAGSGTAERSVLTIKDSVIENNGDDVNDTSGGVWIVSGTPNNDTFVITGTTFFNNMKEGGLSAQLLGDGDHAPTLTIEESTFEMNVSASGGGANVLLSGASTLNIANSDFIENEATSGDGGGLFVSASSSNPNQPAAIQIDRTRFSDNSADAGDGGGLFAELLERASLTITDSTISGNTAIKGGGVYAEQNGAAAVFTLTRSRVEDNEAESRGGGVFASLYFAQAEVSDSVITGNKAGIDLAGSGVIPDSGGGMYAFLFGGSSDPTMLSISGTEISGNEAGRHGGGLTICAKSFLGLPPASQVGVYNSTISGNTAGHTTADDYPGTGGGVHLAVFVGNYLDDELDARFQNVTITENTADTGGGMWSLVPTLGEGLNDVRLTNSIVSANLKHDGTTPSNLWGSFNIQETVYNIIGEDNEPNPMDPEADNIFDHVSHDPADLGSPNIFENEPLLGELQYNGGIILADGTRIQTHSLINDPGGQGTSPAIDAGNNDLAVIPFSDITDPPNGISLTTDQRGNGYPRVEDVPGVNGSDLIVDIGAYEIGLAKVIDVVLDGSNWEDETLTYSYAAIVPDGKQLAPIFTAGVNTIQVAFSEHVTRSDGSPLNGNELQVFGDPFGTLPEYDFNGYNPATHVATWTFTEPLAGDKYRLELSTEVTDVAGNALDGEWDNLTNGTPDDFTDDPDGRTFLSGDGMAGAPMNRFEFWFSLLPGDSDQDGLVEADPSGADDDIQPGVLADIDGDDEVTSADETAAIVFDRDQLTLGPNSGDIMDDDMVDGMDWTAFVAVLLTIDPDGDLNDDGFSDFDDFVIFVENFETYSAWYEGDEAGASGASIPIVQYGIAPQVINVIISGSESVHDPYSFDTVVGSGEQIRTVPVGGADTVSITFSEAVNVSADMLELTGLFTAYQPTLLEFHNDLATQTATWRFEGFMQGDQYVLALSDAITDVEGDRLDGEWTNPASIFTVNSAVSEFPSGDGAGGGDFNFVITLLPGDADLDNIVGSGDVSTLIFNYGLNGVEFIDADFDGDGTVGSGDFDLLIVNFGANLQDLDVLADLNGDFMVDELDAQILDENFGMADPTPADGDLDADGDIDVDDLDLMFTQYGLALALVS